MCFSFEVSLGTFLFSWSVSLYLLNKKSLNKSQTQNIYFLMIYSSIQAIDAILWYINMKKNNINLFLSVFVIPTLLLLQVIYNLYIINNITNPIIYLCIIYVYLDYIIGSDYTVKSCNSFNSPKWGNVDISMITIIIFFILVTYGRIGFEGEKLAFLIILSISLLISIYIGGNISSVWCSLANVLGLYYLFKY